MEEVDMVHVDIEEVDIVDVDMEEVDMVDVYMEEVTALCHLHPEYSTAHPLAMAAINSWDGPS